MQGGHEDHDVLFGPSSYAVVPRLDVKQHGRVRSEVKRHIIFQCAMWWNWDCATCSLGDQFRVPDRDVAGIARWGTAAMNAVVQQPANILSMHDTKDESFLGIEVVGHDF